MRHLMDIANVRMAQATTLAIRLILVETGEARLQPAIIRESFSGFHPVDFHDERM
jgi:hypothetical protein